jgi:hypothetical protein
MSCRMRVALVIAVAGFALAIWGNWEYSSPLRWVPLEEVRIPKSEATFNLRSAAGVFRIDVELPMSEQERLATNGLAMDSNVSCNLVLELHASNDLIGVVNVSTLRQYGARFADNMDCFDGGRMTIPRLGSYSLSVRNLGADSRKAPGTLSLIREENPENAAVLSGICSLLIWFFAGAVVLIFLIRVRRKISAKSSPAI